MGFFDENGYNLTTGTQNISDPLPPPMAYSRFRRRRSFRRRPARTLRRSQQSDLCVEDDSLGVPDVV